jgi:hypothetical protein
MAHGFPFLVLSYSKLSKAVFASEVKQSVFIQQAIPTFVNVLQKAYRLLRCARKDSLC